MLAEARKHLLSKKIYLDTSWVPNIGVLDKQAMADFILEHGPSQILFGSDYPYGDVKKSLDWIQTLPLKDEDKQLILSQNATSLFLG